MRALAAALPTPTTAAGAQPTWRSADERQAAARDAYRAARQRGEVITGAELATRFGMSERWGRDRVAEVRGEGASTRASHRDAVAGAGNGNRTQPTDGNDGRRRSGNRVPPGRSDAGSNVMPAVAGNGNGNGNGNGVALAAADDGKNGSRRPAADGKQLLATAEWSMTAARHQPAASPAQHRIMTTAVIVVASVAAVASYEHQRALAELAGEGWRSLLLPFSVDGLLTTATMLMLTRRRRGQPAGILTWISLILGVTASVAANVFGADPTLADPVLVGRLVAAWPPLALFLSLELLMQHLGIHQQGDER